MIQNTKNDKDNPHSFYSKRKTGWIHVSTLDSFCNLMRAQSQWQCRAPHCCDLPLKITSRCLFLSSQMSEHQLVLGSFYLYTEYAAALNVNQCVSLLPLHSLTSPLPFLLSVSMLACWHVCHPSIMSSRTRMRL